MTLSKPDFNTQESLGAWLRRIRLAHGLDITLAARRIRTRPAVIQALETDNFQALGAPVFIRMYLLRYGELLGLAEHDVLGRFKALGIDDPPPLRVAHPLRSQTRSSDLRWLSYPAAFALIGWLGWTVTQQLPELNDDITPLPQGFELTGINPDQLAVEPSPTPPIVLDTPNLQAEAESTNPIDHIALALSEPEPDVTRSPVLEQPPVTAPNLPLQRHNGLAAVSSAAASEIEPVDTIQLPEPAVNEHELVLEFTDECWVEVEDADGHRLVYALLGANDRRVVQGAAPFSIRLGNAPAAQITLNGQLVEHATYLPGRGSVNRFTLDAPLQDNNAQ
jgi:cytoskeleton protein RodZ